ncbi:MAG TPA: hypothetical protein VIP11_02110 [Gemmatimonadaceae bacterium]
MLELPRPFPIWLAIVITLLTTVISIEIGFRQGRRERFRPLHESERAITDLATPAVGLLGLMLAFTFGWAATRFDARRKARFEEAHTIASVFRYTDFLSAADRERVRAILIAYIDSSLTANSIGQFEHAFAVREGMHQELWAIATRAGNERENSEVVAQFVASTDVLLNDHLERTVAALTSRIPSEIVAGLFIILVMTTGTLGYQMGLTSAVRSRALFPLVLSITVVVYLILDLDRPLEGLLRVRDRGLVEVRRELQAWR